MKRPSRILAALAIAALTTAAPAADRRESTTPGGSIALRLDEAFAALRTYEFGQDRSGPAAIEEALRGASPAALAAVELKLLEVLRAKETRLAGKQYAIRILRRIGSERSVPELTRLLADLELSHFARFALQRHPAAKATAALLGGLETLDGDLRIGVLSSLGDRVDAREEVAGRLGFWVTDPCPVTARAAIRSLGRLGGETAARVLSEAPVAAPLEAERHRALLVCADGLLAAGKAAEATATYRHLAAADGCSGMVRLATHRGLLRTEGAEAIAPVLALLDAEDPALRQGAIRLITESEGNGVSAALAARLPELPAATQVVVIGVLAERGDRAATPTVARSASHPDAAVRLAALGALSALGTADSVEMLLARSLAEGDEASAAFRSLCALSADGVTDVLVRRAREGEAGSRVRAIEALAKRHETAAVPTLLDAARHRDASVRGASYTALGTLSGPDELDDLVAMLVGTDSASERDALAAAIRATVERADDGEMASAEVARGVGVARSAATKAQLIGILPVASSRSGLAALRGLVASKDATVSRAAVRALAAWSHAEPLDDLLAVARGGADADCRNAALDGFIRLAALPGDRPPMATVELLATAIELADRPEPKKRALAALPAFPCREAAALAERLAEDPAVGEAAREAAGRVRSILLASGIVATASHNSGDTKNAFDDNPSTRWATNTPMRPGMWFQVDLGQEQEVARIILDTRNSPGDYPRGCEVYASADGKSWGEPVLEIGPQRPVTRLNFPRPVTTRFIKIVQTGRTDGLYWSIHEMRIVVK